MIASKELSKMLAEVEQQTVWAEISARYGCKISVDTICDYAFMEPFEMRLAGIGDWEVEHWGVEYHRTVAENTPDLGTRFFIVKDAAFFPEEVSSIIKEMLKELPMPTIRATFDVKQTRRDTVQIQLEKFREDLEEKKQDFLLRRSEEIAKELFEKNVNKWNNELFRGDSFTLKNFKLAWFCSCRNCELQEYPQTPVSPEFEKAILDKLKNMLQTFFDCVFKIEQKSGSTLFFMQSKRDQSTAME